MMKKVHFFVIFALAACSAINGNILADLGMISYKDGQYLLSSFNASWVDANNFCKSIGCSLFDVETEVEHNDLIEVFGPAIPDRVWIGGTDLGQESKFYWGHSLEVFGNETFWHVGEPSGTSLHGIKEDCVQYRRVNDTILWNDAPCELAYQFICEVKPGVC